MQANQVTNWFANYALSLSTRPRLFNHPPLGSVNLLWHDVAGVYINRRVALCGLSCIGKKKLEFYFKMI
jgi:hypothetical protein